MANTPREIKVQIKVEPSADDRQAAKAMFSMFTALTDEGFSEQQALVILGQMLAGAAQAAGDQ